MADYTMHTIVDRPYEETVEAVRGEQAEAGFGILTEIDLNAMLKNGLDVDVPPQVILGARRTELAHRALEAEASIAATAGENGDALRAVAADARERLATALAALEGSN